mgnify:FL=1
MRVSLQVKEYIGNILGSYFVTNKIVDIFTASNIPTDKSLSAKWRIAVDAFNKIADEEAFFYILNAFCHPLNFENNEKRLAFINELKTALAYEDIAVQINNRDVLFIKRKTDNESYVHYTKPEKQKTSIDYIVEAINFFKNEYNKVKISGLTYEYCIGEAYATHNDVEYSSDYQGNLEAIKHLMEAGVIRKYEMGAIYNDNGTWETVKCKIDENKLMQKEAPQATVEAEALAQKIIHEHTHKFENSIQEKELPIQKVEIISGKIEVDGLKDGFNKMVGNHKATLYKFPFKLPAGTKWENITIKFENDENIFIQVKTLKHNANFKEMGFIGRGNNPNPSEAWVFLRVLSMAKIAGEITINDSDAKDKYKKQKELLAEQLQGYFSIDYDPFYPYRSSTEKSGNSYKIKITLIPPPAKNMKEEGKDNVSELKEYLDKEMPQIYEE